MFILFLSTQYPAEHLFSLHGRTRLRGPPFRKLRSIRHKGHVIPRIFPLLQKLNAAADVISKDTPNDWVKFALNSPKDTPNDWVKFALNSPKDTPNDWVKFSLNSPKDTPNDWVKFSLNSPKDTSNDWSNSLSTHQKDTPND